MLLNSNPRKDGPWPSPLTQQDYLSMLHAVNLDKTLLELCDGQFPELNETIQTAVLQSLTTQGLTKEHPEYMPQSVYYCAQYCLENGADVNTQDLTNGETPLIKASRGNALLVDLLLRHGAKIDQPDDRGHTPLHTACAEGALHIAQILLDKKANVLSRTINGWSAIHYAIQHPEILLLLLKHNSPCNPKTLILLETPLHFAAMYDAPLESFLSLLAFNGDFTQKNSAGLTAVDILKERKPNSPQFHLLNSEATAFQRECQSHATIAQTTFLVGMYQRHCSDTQTAISLPPEVTQQIVGHTQAEDFSDAAHDDFFQDEDKARVEEKLSRLTLH